MHDRTAQKAMLKRDDRVDSMDWILGYDPVSGWNKPPTVPAFE